MRRSSWVVVVALAAVAAGCGESEAGRASKRSQTEFADGVIVVPERPTTPVVAPGRDEPDVSERPDEPEALGVQLAAADCEALVRPDGRRIHVDPMGSDAADGTADDPLATIQAALDDAQPGDTVMLAAGRYADDARTVRDGEAFRPIVIIGTPESVVDQGRASPIEIEHDHHVFCGFGGEASP